MHIVIVGAGIYGSTLAHALIERGQEVTIIEAAEPGEGTTKASFAWLNNQAFFRNTEGIADKELRRYFGLHRLALGAWRKLDQRVPRLGVKWAGIVSWCAPGTVDVDLINGEIERRMQWGGVTRVLGKEDIEQLIPGCRPGPVGAAFWGTDEGNVDPKQAVLSLVQHNQERGARLLLSERVSGFEVSMSQVKSVSTQSGKRIECDAVAICAGTATPKLAEDLGINVPLVEATGTIVHLAPMPEVLGPVVHAPTFHAAQRLDGRVIVARHYSGTPMNEGVPEGPEALISDAQRYLPKLREGQVEDVTIGKRVLPADGLPIVAQGSDCFNAVALASNAGITLSPLITELVATEMVENIKVDVLDAYRSSRFQSTS